MKIIMCLLAVLACTINNTATAQSWTNEQKSWYVASNIVLLADWATTRDMSRRYHEGYYEHNPILGSRPSTRRVDLHFITAIVAHYFVTDYLQGRDREIYLYTITAVEGAMVANNLNIGLRLRF